VADRFAGVSLPEIHQRYLRLLGISGYPSGLEGLRAVVRAHLFHVPFENVSKLLLFAREGAGRFLSLTEMLDGIEHHDLGGTCHSLNPYLGELLRSLGFDVDLLGADMGERLNCHTCLRVRFDSAAYHVDVGYGGPFREPIRLDRLPFTIIEGGNRYVLEQRGDRYEMSVSYAGEGGVRGYAVHDPPREHAFFADTLRKSFLPEAPFLNCLRICRFFNDSSVTLMDRGLEVHRNGETAAIELRTPAGWEAAFAAHLKLPRCPAMAAVRVLEQNTGKPFFPV
jgi:arylamine N-acetyltransferase